VTAQEVLELPNGKDFVKRENGYGGVRNPHVRRREGRGTIPKASSSAAPVKAALTGSQPKPATQSNFAKESKDETSSANIPASSNAAKKPIPSLKRGGSSGIMQAFAKGAPAKPKKEEQPQNSNLTLSDDGEDDEDIIPKPRAATESDGARKSRQQREAELRRMMDEDDEEEDEENDGDEADAREDTPMGDAEEPVQEPEPEKEKEEPAEIETIGDDGRRRGKRRVMRKKQIMDDQGYLGMTGPKVIPCGNLGLIVRQSQYKSQPGSPSQKTRLPQARSRHRPPLPHNQQLPSLRNRRRKGPKAVSCRSSVRNDFSTTCWSPARSPGALLNCRCDGSPLSRLAHSHISVLHGRYSAPSLFETNQSNNVPNAPRCNFDVC
jgi:DNA polymerase delta subunit 3